ASGTSTQFFGMGDPENQWPTLVLAAVAIKPAAGTSIEVTRAMVLEALAGLATERAMPVEVLARLELERSAPLEGLATSEAIRALPIESLDRERFARAA